MPSYGLGQVGVVRGHEVAEHVGSNHHPLVVAPQVSMLPSLRTTFQYLPAPLLLLSR